MPSTRRRFLAASGVALCGLSGCVTLDRPSAEGTWPRRSFDGANTGRSPAGGPTGRLYEVWHRDRPGRGGSSTSPVVGDGRVYLAYSRESMHNDGLGGSWLEAFDAETGESLWTTELFRTEEFYYFYHSDSLVLDGDRVLVQTKAGLEAVSTDGEVLWTFPNLSDAQQRPNRIPPIVSGGTVVTGTYDTIREDRGETEAVFGLDPADGTERWRVEFPERTEMGALAAADGVVYVPFQGEDGSLVALDPDDGTELWRRSVHANGAPSVSGGRLFLGLADPDENRRLVGAFDPETGERLWRRPTGPRWPDSWFAVADGLVYHVADFGLEARRVEDGERVWRFGGTEARKILLQATPVVADGRVYVNGGKVTDGTYGRLFVVDAASGELRGQFDAGENRYARSAPAVTDELAFVSGENGRLSAVAECGTAVEGHCLVG